MLVCIGGGIGCSERSSRAPIYYITSEQRAKDSFRVIVVPLFFILPAGRDELVTSQAQE